MMTRGFSLYLDFLRFGAAFIVLLSHIAYPRFSDGRWLWIRELNLGSDAVIVFFVLSGLVIAHVAKRKHSGLGPFAFDRITRLVSVALPALVLGYGLDRLGAHLAPAIYAGWYYNPLPLWEMMVRGLSFSSEWTGMATRLGTNGPFWSLSYEAAYYTLFAFAFYLRGLRRVALLLAGMLLFGLNILLLMPSWLMGVALHTWIMGRRRPGRFVSMGLAVLPVVAYALALWTDLPGVLSHMTAGLNHALALRFSDEFVWNGWLGLLVTLHLAGMTGLTSDSVAPRRAQVGRWLAGGSFSLYLIHYPVLQFFAVLPLKSGHGWLDDALLLALTLLIGFVFAGLFERRLHTWRAMLRQG